MDITSFTAGALVGIAYGTVCTTLILRGQVFRTIEELRAEGRLHHNRLQEIYDQELINVMSLLRSIEAKQRADVDIAALMAASSSNYCASSED